MQACRDLSLAKGGVREGIGFVGGDEGDGATAETTSGKPGARSVGLARGLYESILKGAYSSLFDLPQEVPITGAACNQELHGTVITSGPSPVRMKVSSAFAPVMEGFQANACPTCIF